MRAFSFAAIAAAMFLPASVASPVGAGQGKCTGTTGTLTCTGINGAMCSDVGGVWVDAAAGSKDKKPADDSKTCKAANNNNADCDVGSKSKISALKCTTQ